MKHKYYLQHILKKKKLEQQELWKQISQCNLGNIY